jgi:hypothetical protein
VVFVVCFDEAIGKCLRDDPVNVRLVSFKIPFNFCQLAFKLVDVRVQVLQQQEDFRE